MQQLTSDLGSLGLGSGGELGSTAARNHARAGWWSGACCRATRQLWTTWRELETIGLSRRWAQCWEPLVRTTKRRSSTKGMQTGERRVLKLCCMIVTAVRVQLQRGCSARSGLDCPFHRKSGQSPQNSPQTRKTAICSSGSAIKQSDAACGECWPPCFGAVAARADAPALFAPAANPKPRQPKTTTQQNGPAALPRRPTTATFTSTTCPTIAARNRCVQGKRRAARWLAARMGA